MNELDHRREIVQEFIDRLLYLSESERADFIGEVHRVFGRYQTKVLNVNGLRIVPSNSI